MSKTSKTMARWYDAQPKGDWTCSWCGTVGPYHNVQPQHPRHASHCGQDASEAPHAVAGRPTARCCECHNAAVAWSRDERRKARAAEPRCEVQGCRRRQTWNVAGAWMCGQHKSATLRKVYSGGMCAMLGSATMTRDAALALASK